MSQKVTAKRRKAKRKSKREILHMVELDIRWRREAVLDARYFLFNIPIRQYRLEIKESLINLRNNTDNQQLIKKY